MDVQRRGVIFDAAAIGTMSMRNQAGFSLIEILVVVAITVLLFSLLFTPMIASFNLTGEARTKVEAQDAARQNLARITREISDGFYVYDNSRPIIIIPPTKPAGPSPTILLSYAKLDIMMPRMLMHCNNQAHPDSEPRDYARDNPGVWRDELAWPACPSCGSTDIEARPIQPLTPSPRMVRYFIGLKDPSRPYFNGYEGLSTGANDNTYVLYRAEFSLWDVDLLKDSNALNDPGFFYDMELAPNEKTFSQNWKDISKIVGPSKDVDLVDFTWKQDHWVATSRVRFAPTAMQNDPLTPTYLSDTDAEVPDAIPTVFRASQGSWLNSPLYRVVVYQKDSAGKIDRIYYTGPDTDPNSDDIWLYRFNSSGSDSQIFNISRYRRGGGIDLPKPELMLDIDELQGEVRFAFSASETADTDYINDPDNVPLVLGVVQDIPDAAIVPGSETVLGPNQSPAAAPGSTTHYTRVPLALGRIGMNQYKIDYQTGEMWFAPGVGGVLPNGSIRISYKYHNNQPGDIVKADYTTKSLLTIAFGMKIYDHNTGKPHVMELTSKVRVRNMVR